MNADKLQQFLDALVVSLEAGVTAVPTVAALLVEESYFRVVITSAVFAGAHALGAVLCVVLGQKLLKMGNVAHNDPKNPSDGFEFSAPGYILWAVALVLMCCSGGQLHTLTRSVGSPTITAIEELRKALKGD